LESARFRGWHTLNLHTRWTEPAKEIAMVDSTRNFVHIAAVVPIAVLMVSPIEPVKAAILRPQATSVTVRFHSGDLDTPQGVAGLYRRIRAAAETVCGRPDDAMLLDELIWKQCVEQAVAGAVSKVHSDSLSAYQGDQVRGRKRLLLAAPGVHDLSTARDR
jgi:UrcA family protein